MRAPRYALAAALALALAVPLGCGSSHQQESLDDLCNHLCDYSVLHHCTSDPVKDDELRSPLYQVVGDSDSQSGCFKLCTGFSKSPLWPANCDSAREKLTRCIAQNGIDCSSGLIRSTGCDAVTISATEVCGQCSLLPSRDQHGCPDDKPVYYYCSKSQPGDPSHCHPWNASDCASDGQGGWCCPTNWREVSTCPAG